MPEHDADRAEQGGVGLLWGECSSPTPNSRGSPAPKGTDGIWRWSFWEVLRAEGGPQSLTSRR